MGEAETREDRLGKPREIIEAVDIRTLKTVLGEPARTGVNEKLELK